jgi:cytochrome c2
MHDNFRAASAIQTAVIRGDLEALREPARELAALTIPPGLPDAATRHADALSAAARQALDAKHVTAAAVATGTLLAACGSCHRAVGTMPAVASKELPFVGGTVGHMLEHQAAVNQMLRGLVVPSNSEWSKGARALRAAPLHARDVPRQPTLTPELLRVEEAVHRLAEEAVAAESTQNRVRVYSTLLARCADCHSLHRRIWGPPPP